MIAAAFFVLTLLVIWLGAAAVAALALPERDWRAEDFELREYAQWKREREGRGDADGK
jgi:hypothetical protein